MGATGMVFAISAIETLGEDEMAANSAAVKPASRGGVVRAKGNSKQRLPVAGNAVLSVGPRLPPARNDLVPASLRYDMISQAAYFRAQSRGFSPGRDLEDWLEAEQEIDEIIRRRYGY
jgi:hypothetical protein